ncbi:hypothetical protein [Nocardioides convexus]|uniref:hypothetical protein n=1 Tax=Nocardioides convexus TaxID=2712224 RepID=UPI00241874B6|nr:hypothetical protein [Nocardioides convexus]
MTPDVVLMADPRVTSISTRTDGPLPLVDVTGVPRLSVDPRAHDAAGAWRLLRAPVRERLAEAAAALPDGLRLRFVEGYRPPSLQARYFHGYRGRLRTARPHLDEAETRRAREPFRLSPGHRPALRRRGRRPHPGDHRRDRDSTWAHRSTRHRRRAADAATPGIPR